MNNWDIRYNSEEYIYGEAPNGFLKEFLKTNKPGKILLPGDGEGRNSVFAAKQGWQVTAFDSSKIAKQKAQLLASKNNVTINYSVDDVLSYKPQEKFDVIALIFLHLPTNIREVFHKKLKNYLIPKGHIIMECFSKAQLKNTSGGPKNSDLLYSIENLKQDFSGFHINFIQETEIILNEGKLHQGNANVIQLIAKRN